MDKQFGWNFCGMTHKELYLCFGCPGMLNTPDILYVECAEVAT
jgi:hypothetical protein